MIFDADVLIWFLRGNEWAAALMGATQDRSGSIISYMEVLQGAKSKAEMSTFQHFCRGSAIQVLPLTESIGDVAAGLIEEHSLSHGLRVADTLIAATAMETGKSLATANIRHFRPIRNLTLRPFRPSGHSIS